MKEKSRVWIVFSTMEYEGPWIESIWYHKPKADAKVEKLNQTKPDGDELSYYVSDSPYEVQ